ncbi:uncharacterized protein EDB91DRAFT_1101600 [Suillus paluster]|uniref:uncharacterized protein n=1 Tax=Suillus paluster TaxID=48578 RepID=UPI001B876582|nr:uncharacterized protein EDB91DRAFT_1101600 [Suillus paluster]KAG1752290.1 hypothetical protein EDB91DRAFT_1101600 [Suillus paluster]
MSIAMLWCPTCSRAFCSTLPSSVHPYWVFGWDFMANTQEPATKLLLRCVNRATVLACSCPITIRYDSNVWLVVHICRAFWRFGERFSNIYIVSVPVNTFVPDFHWRTSWLFVC